MHRKKELGEFMLTPEKLRCFCTFSGVNSNFHSRCSKNYIHIKITGMNSNLIEVVKITVHSSNFKNIKYI